MSCWVRIFEWIVPRIGVTIQILRIAGIRNDRVRRDEPPQGRVIVTSFIVVEPRCAVQLLARVFVRDIHRRIGAALIRARRSVRIVRQPLHQSARVIRDDAAGTQMVLMPIMDGTGIDRHSRNARISCKDESRAARIVALIELADVAGRRGARNLLHSPTIPVIDERGRLAVMGDPQRLRRDGVCKRESTARMILQTSTYLCSGSSSEDTVEVTVNHAG